MAKKRFSFNEQSGDPYINDHFIKSPTKQLNKQTKDPGEWIKSPVAKLSRSDKKNIEYLSAQMDLVIETLSSIRDNQQFIDEQIKYLKDNRAKLV